MRPGIPHGNLELAAQYDHEILGKVLLAAWTEADRLGMNGVVSTFTSPKSNHTHPEKTFEFDLGTTIVAGKMKAKRGFLNFLHGRSHQSLLKFEIGECAIVIGVPQTRAPSLADSAA